MRTQNQDPRVSVETLERFMYDVLTKVGVPPEDAKIVTDVLITADKFGIDSHGISRLKPIYVTRIRDGILNPVTKIDVVREGPTTAVLDGNHGMGHVIGVRAMELAIKKPVSTGWVWWPYATPVTTASPGTIPTWRQMLA